MSDHPSQYQNDLVMGYTVGKLNLAEKHIN